MTRGLEIDCQDLVELVTDYLEGRLDPYTRDTFDAHLAICPGCAAYLDQMRRTLDGLGSLRPEPLSPAARDTLLTAFRGMLGR